MDQVNLYNLYNSIQKLNESEIEIYIDGSCSPNPGTGGWGVLVQKKKSNEEIVLSGAKISTTNNEMELQAAISALSYIFNYIESSKPVKINTDSQYVKEGITSWIKDWKQNNWKRSNHKPVKNQNLWQELDEMLQKCQSNGKEISWNWVKGHNKNEGNVKADLIANEARSKFLLTNLN